MTIKAIVFDLDQTLIDTTSISVYRERYDWDKCQENFHTTHVFENVKKIMQEFRENMKIGIVTNSPRKYAEDLLEYHDILYDAIVPFNAKGKNKPYPDQLLSCIQKMEVDAEHALYVGDDVIDIVAAKAAGLISIGYAENKEKAKNLLLAMPHAIIFNFLELKKYVSYRNDKDIINKISILKDQIKIAKSNGNGSLLFTSLKKASELGDGNSQFALAKLLYKNSHLVEGEKDHFYFFWMAAYQMYPDAIYALAHFIEVEDKKKEEAEKFYRIAAYLDNNRAKYKFAVSKMNSNSEFKLKIADAYLKQAYDNGVREAWNSRKLINSIFDFEEKLKTVVSYNEKKNVFYLSDYIPSTSSQNPFSKQIIKVKQGEESAINYFVKELQPLIKSHLVIVNVPSSDMNKRVTGIRRIGLGLSKFKGKDGTECLLRTCSKEKSSLGGERNIEVHLKTMTVQNAELVKGKHILLLDDIITTGSSIVASEKLLLEAGALHVTKFALGKTKS